MTDIQQSVGRQVGFGTSEGDSLRAPEAVSVLVLTTDEVVAIQIAPLLAGRLYPSRNFSAVVHAEWVGGEDPGYRCDVLVDADRPSISAIQNGR